MYSLGSVFEDVFAEVADVLTHPERFGPDSANEGKQITQEIKAIFQTIKEYYNSTGVTVGSFQKLPSQYRLAANFLAERMNSINEKIKSINNDYSNIVSGHAVIYIEDMIVIRDRYKNVLSELQNFSNEIQQYAANPEVLLEKGLGTPSIFGAAKDMIKLGIIGLVVYGTIKFAPSIIGMFKKNK